MEPLLKTFLYLVILALLLTLNLGALELLSFFSDKAELSTLIDFLLME